MIEIIFAAVLSILSIIIVIATILWVIAMAIALGFSLYLMGWMLYDSAVDPRGVWK